MNPVFAIDETDRVPDLHRPIGIESMHGLRENEFPALVFAAHEFTGGEVVRKDGAVSLLFTVVIFHIAHDAFYKHWISDLTLDISLRSEKYVRKR